MPHWILTDKVGTSDCYSTNSHSYSNFLLFLLQLKLNMEKDLPSNSDESDEDFVPGNTKFETLTASNSYQK